MTKAKYQLNVKKNVLQNDEGDLSLVSTTNKLKKLEVLIPVYNQEFYCSRIIKNIESYISSEIGVLIQDDCSTDGTFEILSNHFQNHESVKVFKTKKNIGPNGNFMSLTERVTSEYLLGLGGDDFINQGAIQQLLGALNSEPFDIGIFNCVRADIYTIDHIIFGAAKPSEKLNVHITNKSITNATELNTNNFFTQIATMPGALWLQGVVIRAKLFKLIPKMESSNVDDWGICHNLAVYNLDHSLTVKTYDFIISALTITPNSRGSQWDEQLRRQLSAVVNDWHPLFRKDAFYNVILKKITQLHNSNLSIEEELFNIKNSFSKIELN